MSQVDGYDRFIGICNRCDASILWVATTGGKRMPVDPEPTMDGLLILIEPIPGADIPLAVNKSNVSVEGYTSHYATCARTR